MHGVSWYSNRRGRIKTQVPSEPEWIVALKHSSGDLHSPISFTSWSSESDFCTQTLMRWPFPFPLGITFLQKLVQGFWVLKNSVFRSSPDPIWGSALAAGSLPGFYPDPGCWVWIPEGNCFWMDVCPLLPPGSHSHLLYYFSTPRTPAGTWGTQVPCLLIFLTSCHSVWFDSDTTTPKEELGAPWMKEYLEQQTPSWDYQGQCADFPLLKGSSALLQPEPRACMWPSLLCIT